MFVLFKVSARFFLKLSHSISCGSGVFSGKTLAIFAMNLLLCSSYFSDLQYIAGNLILKHPFL